MKLFEQKKVEDYGIKYEQHQCANPASADTTIRCGLASRPPMKALRPIGALLPNQISHWAFWYQTPDGVNHYIGLGKGDRKRLGWRRESTHKDNKDQFGLKIHSDKDSMPLAYAKDEARMDQLAETALARHDYYDLTENNCQHYARILLQEFAYGRDDRPEVSHADDRRLLGGATDYNTQGLRATYELNKDAAKPEEYKEYNHARCFADPTIGPGTPAYARAMKEIEDSPEYRQAMKKKEEALQRGSSGFTEWHREPMLVHVAIEREVTVSGGPIGFPEGRFVEQSEPERQSRRLPGKRNVYHPQE